MKVVRSYKWNDKDYTIVELDDGTRQELRCTSDEAPAIVDKLASIPEPKPKPEPERLEITAFSAEVLLAEVDRRGLMQAVLTETK